MKNLKAQLLLSLALLSHHWPYLNLPVLAAILDSASVLSLASPRPTAASQTHTHRSTVHLGSVPRTSFQGFLLLSYSRGTSPTPSCVGSAAI